MKKRYMYLDVLKCIAIFCVCAYHFSWVNNIGYSEPLMTAAGVNRFFFGINSICVPMFFMVNGALLLNKGYKRELWLKNMAFIVLQCLMWRFLTIMFICMGNGINPLKNGMRYFADAVFFGTFEGINLSHMWFIYALIIVYMLFPFIKSLFDESDKKDNYIWVFMILLFVLCFVTKTWITVVKVLPFLGGIEFENIRNFIPFDGMYGPMLFYFILGGVFHKYQSQIKRINIFSVAAVFLVGTLGLYIKWYYESAAINTTYDNVFYGYDCVSGMGITVSVYLIIMKLEQKLENMGTVGKSFVNFIGRNTMNVYYIHWIIGFTLLPYLYNKVMEMDGIALNIVKAIILVLLCSILGELLGKIPCIKYLFRRKK